MKSYTDLEQSKKLAEILPLESADYTRLGKNEDNVLTRPYFESCSSELNEWVGQKNLFPCWSLAALLGVIPNYELISKHNYHTCIAETSFGKETVAWFDNPVDACYKMIIKLHEKKFIVIMKELSIVEKAKAYDEAVINGSRLWECGDITRENYEYIFPELKESEDEKIRKELYDFCIKCSRGDTLVNQQADFQRWASWLEKQGEFKSSKWKEGDVVRYEGVLALVTNGRKAMKSNCEQITIQYPDEWVKAETWERKYFFEELEKQDEQKHANKKEEIDNLHNYLYGEQKLAEWHREDEQNLNVCLSYIPDEFLRRWLTDIIRVKYDKPADKVEPKFKVGDWITDL